MAANLRGSKRRRLAISNITFLFSVFKVHDMLVAVWNNTAVFSVYFGGGEHTRMLSRVLWGVGLLMCSMFCGALGLV